ncbi:hypothetical protein ASPFODRAFT_53393 [Aspergillus luchuensis CBS 106.47]|uniref:Uncharacterized protein n=1 Tax=Aspergillus luchuensis (strain CBS 106.47) TaxID=1137211 RepID=A0A1M3T0P4_ASPLC|nr:hypothetical protein ASPFODRAFT_53393 [Aspergillus luchuensis CBS 106.47]
MSRAVARLAPSDWVDAVFITICHLSLLALLSIFETALAEVCAFQHGNPRIFQQVC